MIPQEIIRKKREKKILTNQEIETFVKGLTDNSFSDSHIAAMSMAIYLNGMNVEETVSLTKSMTNSGNILNWKGVVEDSFICDKHSTGGVGDKVSLLLAPIIAACGGYVPMISGRGLGHTGGTLDKFDSIPGYNTQPDIETFQKVVKKVGCAIIGQTSNLAPADKKLYAIRDIVGTVESIPLITSSILSKKIASGINYLVLDIKVGNGSFNKTKEIANNLAELLVNVAKNSNMKCTAILTDMNQVLGFNAGHSLEIIECINFFNGIKKNKRLEIITHKLAAELLCMNRKDLTMDFALKKILNVIDSGKASEKFEQMVAALGGPKNILSNYKNILPNTKYTEDIFSDISGYIESISTRELGMILIELGGGRKNISDKIDYSVGYSNVVNVGDKIDTKTPLLTIHAKNKEDIKSIKKRIKDSFIISDNTINPLKDVYGKVN
tara:strand:+ start:1272 stop:2588 length:1317 start_codon:yes stop_codon:yes gene_type:complete